MSSLIKKALLSIGLAAASAGLAHAGNQYSVDLNKTEIVYLPENAGAVVIGNPDIADVSIHSANTLFVVGRGYGETNLVVLNNTGQTIMNADIQVVNTLSAQGVRLYNGKERNTFNCAPYCQPAPVLGDNPAFIGANSGGNNRINSNVSTALPTGGSSPSPLSGGPQSRTSSTAPTQPSGPRS